MSPGCVAQRGPRGPCSRVLVLLAAIAAPAAAVPTPGPELWRQLAALPYLAAQAMEGRKEELVGTLAQGMAEAAEKQLMQHATDQVVVGVCSNQTKALAKRLERALEKAPWDEDAGAKPLQEAATNVLLAKATSIVSPPQGAALSASSHLQLAEAAPPFLGDANDARSTSTLLEHVWRQLPEMLLQSVDAQAVDALRELNATALALVEAMFNVADDLRLHRAPDVSGVRVAGGALLGQLTALSGVWSPTAAQLVTTTLEEKLLKPLTSSSSDLIRHLAATTGEDVAGAFNVLLGEKEGNKVDAMQTLLRSLLQLHRTAYLALIEDCRKLTSPWEQNVTAAAIAMVDAVRFSSVKSLNQFEQQLESSPAWEVILAVSDEHTSKAIMQGLRHALEPLRSYVDDFWQEMAAELAGALEGSFKRVLEELGTAAVQDSQQDQAAPFNASTGTRQSLLLDKWQTVTRSGFAAMHHALSRHASSATDLLEVRDNLQQGARATISKLTDDAIDQLRDSAKQLRRTYMRGVRRMARSLTSELLLGMRQSLLQSGVCAESERRLAA